MTSSTVLSVVSLDKRFGGVQALQDVHFELRRGEIHALVGENGAGKSTFIRILTGLTAPDRGRITVDGSVAVLPTPASARTMGIAVIHQDFDLAGNLTIADNLSLGREPVRNFGIVDGHRQAKFATGALATVGLDLDPTTFVDSLTIAERQMLAIARAVAANARILVMDEPTSALAADDIERLLSLLQRIRDSGTAIIFVSHKLDEIYRIADRISVFRDGRSVATRNTAETDRDRIVALMVGRELAETGRHKRRERTECLLEARNLSQDGAFSDVSFSVSRGEVLGLYGLKGAGRGAILRSLFGLEGLSAGELILEGDRVAISSPRVAMEMGIGLVPGDRQAQGLFPNMTVAENLSFAALPKFAKGGLLSPARERAAVMTYLHRLAVRIDSPQQMMLELSGGNQQKILLARWLMNDPRLLLLEEPTAGIDVRARSEIYELIRQQTSRGSAVLLVSSDLPEVLSVSDRLLVVDGGGIVGRFNSDDASEQAVMQCIYSGAAA